MQVDEGHEPLFRDTDILDIDDASRTKTVTFGLNTRSNTRDEPHTTGPTAFASIFRAYDIRGVVGDTDHRLFSGSSRHRLGAWLAASPAWWWAAMVACPARSWPVH